MGEIETQVEVGRYLLLNEVLLPYNLRCCRVEHRQKKVLHIRVNDFRGDGEEYLKVLEDNPKVPYMKLAQQIIDDYVNTGIHGINNPVKNEE